MSELTRTVFAEELHALEQDLLWMGSVIEQMLHKALEALTTQSVTLAEETRRLDGIVDEYKLNIENKCLNLLARQQPMARDLRTITTLIKIIADFERAGDYAAEIAETSTRLTIPGSSRYLTELPQLEQALKRMLREVLGAFANRSLEQTFRVMRYEEQVDQRYATMRAQLVETMRTNPAMVADGVSLLMVLHALERLADHLTNIGKRIYYMETGALHGLQ
ncbi:MAG TPA: phosphate signaling complex protein PhoU [Armatimonadota bacterium]|jgi:phosphate transport system protein